MPKRRGDGDGSIAQRCDGLWRARLRYIDPVTKLARRLELYGATRSDAVEKLDDARRRLRARKAPRDERITLSAFLKIWIRDVVTPTKRPSTVRSYESIVEQHLIPSKLGAMTLRDLREVQVQHILVAASKASPRIQQLCLIVLRRALDQAVKWQLLQSNPAIGITPPRIGREAPRVLSPTQARAFLEATKADRLYALYFLALDTGMRQGELLALHWSDVDLEAGVIRVSRSMDNHTGAIGATKTRAGRRQIAVSSATLAVIRDHKRRMTAEGQRGALVFVSTSGTPLSPPNVRLRSFLPAQKVAEIDPPIRFHDLRHTAATLMLGAGVNPKIASERLGHATIAITMDTYQHVAPSMQREAADIIGSVLVPRKGAKSGGSRQRRKAKKPRAV